ncbi:hypothetical protein E1J61_35135 [Cupriavidus sp. L7L]|nr:hypothetical protein E1J61_35135 [Cupriavidus sp. L7L]
MPLASAPTPTGFGARLRRLIRRPSGNALRQGIHDAEQQACVPCAHEWRPTRSQRPATRQKP